MNRSTPRRPWFLGAIGTIAVVGCLALAGCGSTSEASNSSGSTEGTQPLSTFSAQECVPKGWQQEPLLVDLAAAPDTPLDSFSDEVQVRAMDIVVGCFDVPTLTELYAGVQEPFKMPASSAGCLAETLVTGQSGAAFLGLGAFTAAEPPTVSNVDVRTPAIAALRSCVPPTAHVYGVVLASFVSGAQNAAVDRTCVDRSYLEQTDGLAFWTAAYDLVVLNRNSEENNRLVYEPGLHCVSFGQAYALSVKADTGVDLSGATTACIDQQLDALDSVEVLLTTGTNQALIDEAAGLCLSPSDRAQFEATEASDS